MSPFRIVVSLLLAVTLLASGTALAAPGDTPDASAAQAAASSVLFIENAGQWPAEARFQVWASPFGIGTTWLTEDAIWISVVDGGDPSPDRFERRMPPGLEVPVSEKAHGVNLKLSFVGANPHPRLEPADPVDTTVSYFLGDDPAQWRLGVPVWGGVRYVDLYPGIDLVVGAGEGWQPAGTVLPWHLITRAGADLYAVQLRVEGAGGVTLAKGGLRVNTEAGEISLPLLAVEGLAVGGAQVEPGGVQTFDVTAPFAVASANAVRPARSSPADDPADLLYGTFVGGSSRDESESIVVDSAGSVYVTGWTSSSDFPTTAGAFDPSYNGGDGPDAFVVKLNAAGSALAYATFLGGSGNDRGIGIAIDGAGRAYVTGTTYSSDFPTTPGAFDPSHNGGTCYTQPCSDAFVVKLNAAGSALLYGTFLGGGSGDEGESIVVDSASSVYVTGWTSSSDFPTTPGVFDPSYNGGDGGDAFVVKLNAAGSALAYATFLGGIGSEYGSGIVVDGAGSAYVTGPTSSSDFPTTPGAFDPSYNGGRLDAFMIKLNAAGSALAYATFLGGGGDDNGYRIAVGGTGSAYVTGWTSSSDFPTTPGAFDPSYNGGDGGDAFVVKLNEAGSVLAYATYLGGSGSEHGSGIAIDGAGSAYVTGPTSSGDFPTTPGAFDPSYNGVSDTFVVKLNAAGSALAYATYLGGSDVDYDGSIAIDGAGRAYVTGLTYSSDFPTTPGAYDRSYNDGGDTFVVKLNMPAYTPHIIAPIEQPAAGAIISGTVTLSGFAIDLGSSTGTGIDAVHIYLDGPHGTGTFIGAATYGFNRPDVGAQYGTRFGPSGWERTWDTSGVVPGIHWLYLYVHRTTGDAWVLMPGHLVVVAGGHTVWLPFAPSHE